MSKFVDEIASDQGFGLQAILNEAEQDASTWENGAMPNTETLRRMILLADWASQEPLRWQVYRMKHISQQRNEEIAKTLNIAVRTVRRCLRPVHLKLHPRSVSYRFRRKE